jgi:hypothetical protein
VIVVMLMNGVETENSGTKRWYKDGRYHRLDGPAIEFATGQKHWFQYGRCHRLDGPAIEQPDGGIKRWFINDIEYSEQTYWALVKNPNLINLL